MKTICMTLAVCLALIGLSCAKDTVVLLDRPTAPGEVPPPKLEGPAKVEPYRPYPEESAVPAAPSGLSAADMALFKAKYHAAKSPRIAVYLNRQLSANVREWESNVRVATDISMTTTTKDGSKTKTESTQGTVATAVQTRADEGDRGAMGPETWQWRLEDAIANQLLGAGVKMVDRALMMRLTAADAVPAGTAPAVKTVETNALRGKADILVEIVVSNDPDPKLGYLYRVRAYDIDSGQVLLSTSSANWPPTRRAKGELVTTDRGYERTALPKPETIGGWLAQDLMSGLAARW